MNERRAGGVTLTGAVDLAQVRLVVQVSPFHSTFARNRDGLPNHRVNRGRSSSRWPAQPRLGVHGGRLPAGPRSPAIALIHRKVVRGRRSTASPRDPLPCRAVILARVPFDSLGGVVIVEVELERLLTVEEAAAVLRLHPKTVVRWCRSGRIVGRRVGNHYRFRLADLQRVGDAATATPTRSGGELASSAETRPAMTSSPAAITASRASRSSRRDSRLARVVAICMRKGGVGKTITTHALGAALAGRGDEVLVVDMDPQASLTKSLGFGNPARLSPALYDLMEQYILTKEDPETTRGIYPVIEHLSLLPSNHRLALAEMTLVTTVRGEYVLSEVLAPVRSAFDWILIDCPPSLSILSVNALTVADQCLIPVQPEPMVTAELEPVLDAISGVRRSKLNPALTVAGVVLTRVDPRPTLDRQIVEELRQKLPNTIPILGTIQASVKVREAFALNLLLSQYKPAADVMAAYRQVAEVLRGSDQ